MKSFHCSSGSHEFVSICPRRQQGVALVLALLIVALAVTLVAGMFWLQHVQVRALALQQAHQQARAVLRLSMDETRQLLRLDAMQNGSVTSLEGAWARAQPLGDLGRLLPHNAADGPASLQLTIIDAQSRFNLRNLAHEGQVDAVQLAVFGRLLAQLRLDPSLAKGTATALAASGAAASTWHFTHMDDLLAISGYTPQVLRQLREHAVLLPVRSRLNANTAPAALLAVAGGMPLPAAAALVHSRAQARLRDAADISLRLPHGPAGSELGVGSDFFLVESDLAIGEVRLRAQALVHRQQGGRFADAGGAESVLPTTVVWLRHL